MPNVNFKTAVFLWFFVIFGALGTVIYSVNKIQERAEEEYLEELGGQPNSPTCLVMYHWIEKYSKQYKVPKYIAYNVAYLETGYRGPFHWSYDPYRTSSAGAVGPMQIITRWAHKYAGRRVSEKELRTDLELNVRVSMKMLRERYRITHDWGLACGGYNTGSHIMNDYAVFCASNKNYKNNWVSYSR